MFLKKKIFACSSIHQFFRDLRKDLKFKKFKILPLVLPIYVITHTIPRANNKMTSFAIVVARINVEKHIESVCLCFVRNSSTS